MKYIILILTCIVTIRGLYFQIQGGWINRILTIIIVILSIIFIVSQKNRK